MTEPREPLIVADLSILALKTRIFELVNANVFDGRLPANFRIVWNGRLKSMSGKCCFNPNNGACWIELNIKVVNTPGLGCWGSPLKVAERLRDVLVHELCHAAVFFFDQVKDGHGPLFQKWAEKICAIYSELSLEEILSRHHTYPIETKFLYRCTGCAKE